MWSALWIWQRWTNPEAILGDSWTLMGFVLGFGFAGNLVAGIGPQLLSKMGGYHAPPTWTLVLASLGFDVAAAIGAIDVIVHDGGTAKAGAASALLVAAFGLVSAVALQILGARHDQLCPGARVRRPTDGWPKVLVAGALAYGAAAALLGARNGFLEPWILHLWLLGLVALAIYAVFHQFLPRFTRAMLPRWLHAVQAIAALISPGLVAWAIAGGGLVVRDLAAGSALAAAVGCLAMVVLAAGRRRSQSPVLIGLVFATVFLVLGVVLGIRFLGGAHQLLHVHAVFNLVGFVGIAALSMGSVFLGVGIRAAEREATLPLKWALGLTAVAVFNWGALWLVVGRPIFVADLFLGTTVLFHSYLGLKSLQPPRILRPENEARGSRREAPH